MRHRSRKRPAEHREFKPHGFFATRSFFGHREWVDAYRNAGRTEVAATRALAYYSKGGVITSVRRGLYRVTGSEFDALAIPSALHPEAVLAYEGAAIFHGLVPLEHGVTYLTPAAVARFEYSEVIFRGVCRPEIAHVEQLPHRGTTLAVTAFHRTLLDCLDRLDLGPDPALLYREFLEHKWVQLDEAGLLRLVNTERSCGPVAFARLGLLLSSHPQFARAERLLDAVHRRIPVGTSYATAAREPGGVYFSRWRVVVPEELVALFER